MSSIRLTRGPAIHYGWVILAAGTFGSFMTLPGQTAGVSVFFDPITADLGISRTWASIERVGSLWPVPIWHWSNPESCCYSASRSCAVRPLAGSVS